ncbi:HET-domain-containing protein [Melanogaster broomeanus]|nr:HET-domain-containing protein [Melanogaster broomeanus]
MQCWKRYHQEIDDIIGGRSGGRPPVWVRWVDRTEQAGKDEVAPERQRIDLIPYLRQVSSTTDVHNIEHDEDPARPDEVIESLVCDNCWNRLFADGTFQKAWNDDFCVRPNSGDHGGFSYCTTRSEVFKSYVAGCQWCSLLETHFGGRLLRLDPRFVHTIYVGTIPASQNSIPRGCSAPLPKGARNLQISINGTTSSYLTYTTSDDNASKYVPARNLVLQVGSSRAIQLVLECMQRCIKTHSQCPTPRQAELPTRIIDCSDIEKPKIMLGHGRRGRYAALSYVWGGPQFRSTTSNIDKLLRDGIDRHVLSQTITDAIDTTHNLGIPYLWVDALCIIQDSEVDKATEIGRMRAVYHNAHVTIIAASSARAADGFLQDRMSPPHTRLPFRCPNGRLGTFSLVHDVHNEKEDLEPVDTRGWCLQERLLSPRALIYTKTTLQFECQMETVNVGGAVCPPSRVHRLPQEIFSASLAPDAHFSVDDGVDVLEETWQAVVMDCARRDVTDPMDKLVAFAGLAEQFQLARRGDEYLAGLWRRSLCRDILWKRHKRRVRPMPKDYRAPSWSWAATDGEIMVFNGLAGPRFDIRISCDLCEVVACEVTPASARAAFGGVIAGTLVIRAQMLQINRDQQNPRIVDTFDLGPCTQCVSWTESNCKEDEFPWSSKAFVPAETDDHAINDKQVITAYSACVEWLDADGEETKPTHAIPVGWNEGIGEEKQRMIAGLLVACASTNSAGNECYRRLGYFETKPGILWHFHNDPAHRQLITLV